MKNFVLLFCGVLFLLWPDSRMEAREIFISPITNHQPLTCTTDDLSGYQVMPHKPLKLDLVGPGTLNLTIRLNHTKPYAEFTGSLVISRNDKPVKNLDMKLFRSRVGNYLQNKKLFFSLPKKLRIVVPEGIQHYVFSLKPGNCHSLYLAIQYESEADQSPVARGDMLALVPLGEAMKSEGEELPLVPVGPTQQPQGEKEPTAKTSVEVAAAPAEKEAVKIVPPALPKQGAEVQPTALPTAEPRTPPPVVASAPEVSKSEPTEKTANLSPEPSAPAEIVQARSPQVTRGPTFSIGAKLGQIAALQKVGGVSFTGSFEARYILPVLEGRFSVGVEAGAYRYRLEIASDNRVVTTWVVPISLELYYSLPLKARVQPFLGLGADVFWCQGRDEHIYSGYLYSSTSNTVFGAHFSAGIEGKLGPGLVLGELRAGLSFGNPGTWLNNPNIYGLAAVVGYRLVF